MNYVVSPSLLPKIKAEYVQGFGSVREICEKYNVPFKPVEVRGSKEGWTQERESYLKGVCENSLANARSEAEEWLKEVRKTSRKEWNYITESIETLVQSGQGIDSDNINGYARARKTYDDLVRRSLGLVDPSQRLDVTSGGKTIGESLVEALAKLRANPDSAPALTDSEIEVAVECEIVD